MSMIGKPERETQNRVIGLFRASVMQVSVVRTALELLTGRTRLL
jgi:hypothetical protein